MLIVFAGLPGTGKTTLSRRLAAELSAAVVRVDAIEAAIVRSTDLPRPLGPVGYVVAHEVAAACLAVGTTVVIDAVSPVPEARAGWRTLGAAAGVPVQVFEVVLFDLAEHRRRVRARGSDLNGLVVPTWSEVLVYDYQPWDPGRDGPRTIIDGLDADEALAAVHVQLEPSTARTKP